MFQGLAVVIGVWLIGVALVMVALPRRALDALGRMGGTATTHFGELILRVLAGVTLVLVATASRYPAAVTVIGWFLVASALILMALPRRWHAAYSTWWAKRIPVLAVRLLAPVSAFAGGALIWTVL